MFLFTLTMLWINKYRLLIDYIFLSWSSTVDIYASFLDGVRQLCVLAKL